MARIQRKGTCRINKIPKSIFGKSLYEVRCVKKSGRVIIQDSTTKRGALKLKKLLSKRIK